MLFFNMQSRHIWILFYFPSPRHMMFAFSFASKNAFCEGRQSEPLVFFEPLFFLFFLFLSFRWSLKIWNFMVEHTHTHAHWAQHSMEHLNELQFSAEFLHIPRFFFFFHRNLFELNAWLTGWPNKKKMAGRSRLEYVFARFMGAHNPGERQTDIGPWHSFVCILLFTVILLEIWPFTVRLHWKRNPFNLYTLELFSPGWFYRSILFEYEYLSYGTRR